MNLYANLTTVRKSKFGGRGLFAATQLLADHTLEVNHLLFLWKGYGPFGTIDKYVFDWTNTKYALAMGNISFCNHSLDPNARIEFVKPKGSDYVAKLIAKRDIARNEEITINYGGEGSSDESWLPFRPRRSR